MSSLRPQKAVAVVEWNWTGHHPAHFNKFIMALEELGHDVLAISPDPTEAAQLADTARAGSGADCGNRGKTEYLKIGVSSSEFRAGRSGGIRTVYWTVRFFRSIERQVREWSRRSGQKVESIFYCCIYDWEFAWARLAQPFLSIPWTGLYVHARSLRMPGTVNPVTSRVPRPEFMFGGGLCRGIAVLDEGKCREAAALIRKPVVVLPEVTDDRLTVDAAGEKLGQELEAFAAGRPIVGLFGHLGLSKGLMTFLAAAKASDPGQTCFALVGERGWPDEDDQAIRRIIQECPNLWCLPKRIPDEAHLNHLMSKCQVLFAAYLDFPHSSGIMSKAALLEKPMIVSDGYLLAERTQKFNLGEVIPQGDHEACLEAISKITQNSAGWITRNQPQWADYRRANSFDRFKDSLNELLANVNHPNFTNK